MDRGKANHRHDQLRLSGDKNHVKIDRPTQQSHRPYSPRPRRQTSSTCTDFGSLRSSTRQPPCQSSSLAQGLPPRSPKRSRAAHSEHRRHRVHSPRPRSTTAEHRARPPASVQSRSPGCRSSALHRDESRTTTCQDRYRGQHQQLPRPLGPSWSPPPSDRRRGTSHTRDPGAAKRSAKPSRKRASGEESRPAGPSPARFAVEGRVSATNEIWVPRAERHRPRRTRQPPDRSPGHSRHEHHFTSQRSNRSGSRQGFRGQPSREPSPTRQPSNRPRHCVPRSEDARLCSPRPSESSKPAPQLRKAYTRQGPPRDDPEFSSLLPHRAPEHHRHDQREFAGKCLLKAPLSRSRRISSPPGEVYDCEQGYRSGRRPECRGRRSSPHLAYNTPAITSHKNSHSHEQSLSLSVTPRDGAMAGRGNYRGNFNQGVSVRGGFAPNAPATSSFRGSTTGSSQYGGGRGAWNGGSLHQSQQ